jgi:serine/threonine protein kinase
MPDLTGQQLSGRYTVREFLGRGGMADVYRVYDSKRSVELALKLLHADLAQDVIFLRRFRREAQTLARLQHPHIVRFFGFEQDDLQAFMLMEFVDGSTLRSEIFRAQGKGMPLERILGIMKPVCAALQYAHGQGFIHCDIKPANIMLDKNGAVLVADFGIARMTESATTTTLIGAGTPAYMAPEQVLGEMPSPQTDIYALGILLYEMLTGGERPFTGEQAGVTGTTAEKLCWEHVNLPAPTPRKFNPAITSGMEVVVLKCLEKNPAHRFNMAQELFQALTLAAVPAGTYAVSAWSEPVISSGQSQPTTPPRPAEGIQPRLWSAILAGNKKNLFIGVSALLLVVALMTLLSVGNHPASSAPPATRPATSIPQNTLPIVSPLPTFTLTSIPTRTLGMTATTTPAPGDITRLDPYNPHTGEQHTYLDFWKWPVLPVVSQRAKVIYQKGLANGNDPRHFSTIGDNQVTRENFLGYFDQPDQSLRLGDTWGTYKPVLENFSGSYFRLSMTVRTDFNVASVLSPINSDPAACKAGETPLECEMRSWKPSIAIVSMETWFKDRPTQAYEGYLRQIVDFLLARDILPILATKADNLEGNNSINTIITRVAYEYDIPLWNFYAAAQPLPLHGLLEDGFHLTNGESKLYDEGLQIGWNMRNLTALQMLDKVWKEVKMK